jgi:hypothetical protein
MSVLVLVGVRGRLDRSISSRIAVSATDSTPFITMTFGGLFLPIRLGSTALGFKGQVSTPPQAHDRRKKTNTQNEASGKRHML